jgi:aspartate 1-decarboxylase
MTKATITATVQSSIGDIAAGSVFAIFTSAGAGGTGLVTLNGAAQACGAALAADNGALAWVKAKM